MRHAYSTLAAKRSATATVVLGLLLTGCAAPPPKILETEAVHLDVVRSGSRYIETARVHDRGGRSLLMGRVRFPVPHIEDPVGGHVDRRILAGGTILAECTMQLRASFFGPPGADAIFHGLLPSSNTAVTVRLEYHDEDQHGADCDA